MPEKLYVVEAHHETKGASVVKSQFVDEAMAEQQKFLAEGYRTFTYVEYPVMRVVRELLMSLRRFLNEMESIGY